MASNANSSSTCRVACTIPRLVLTSDAPSQSPRLITSGDSDTCALLTLLKAYKTRTIAATHTHCAGTGICMDIQMNVHQCLLVSHGSCSVCFITHIDQSSMIDMLRRIAQVYNGHAIYIGQLLCPGYACWCMKGWQQARLQYVHHRLAHTRLITCAASTCGSLQAIRLERGVSTIQLPLFVLSSASRDTVSEPV